MQAMIVSNKDLLPAGITVEAGVAEVVRPQKARSTFLKPSL